MTVANYAIFGIGLGASDVRYIGWVRRSLQDVGEQVRGLADTSSPLAEAARNNAKVSIFEIESVSTAEDARDATSFWHEYFRSLGLDVAMEQVEQASSQAAVPA